MARRSRLDLTSAIGLPAGICLLVFAQIIEGGSLRTLLQLTAASIVVGGTLAAVLVSFSLHEIRGAIASLRTVFADDVEPAPDTINAVIQWAGRARRQGLVALEDDLPRVTDPFLRKGLRLAVDGVAPHEIREILELENARRGDDEEAPSRVFEAAAGYAPTFGILGAVLGLIQVMQHLSDPARLGAGIAVAFVATVYGVGLANLVLMPLATKLRSRVRRNERRRQLMVEGAVGISEGVNPRALRDRLNSFGGTADVEGVARHERVA